jgi:hypothetical protein
MLVREAMRRAVDIRDTNARGGELSARPLVLVDVLNALSESLQVDGSDVWDGSDLWNAPRFGDAYGEAAFWEHRNQRQG